MTDLSIIVISFNTNLLLKRCLDSILNNVDGIEYEIIVVDNDSVDKSPQMVRRNYSDVRLIENKKNIGFAAANNQALEISRGKYILLLNSDTIVLNNALFKMMDYLEDNPQCGGLGCRLLNPDGSMQISARKFPTLISHFLSKLGTNRSYLNNDRMRKLRMIYDDYNHTRGVDWLCGACFMTRKKVVDEVGPLDENYFMYAEDMDWCFRIKSFGWELVYFPNAEVIHLGGESAMTYQNEKIHDNLLYTEYIKSNYRFIYKRYGLIYYSSLIFLEVLFNLFLISKHSFSQSDLSNKKVMISKKVLNFIFYDLKFFGHKAVS